MISFFCNFSLLLMLTVLFCSAGHAMNGACGSANGVAMSSAPSSGLCSAGTATGVYGNGYGGGPWFWNCNGSGGGSTAYCEAPLAVAANPSGNSTSTTNPPGSPIPATFFGMHIEASTDWPSSQTIIGAKGKCSGATWPYLEPSRGSYNWSNMDYCLSVAQSHGVSLFYSSDCTASNCSGGIPSWTTCANLVQDYGNFYQKLVSRYGAQLIYELWNEPDSIRWGAACTPSQVAAAMNAAHDAVRSLAPKATILAASGTPHYMAILYQAGLTQDVDAITFHEYTDGIEGVGTTPEGVIQAYNDLGSAMSSFPTVATKPVWMTEGAAYSNYPGGAGIPSDINLKAAYIARFYILLQAEGIIRAYWYAWDDQDFGPIMQYPIAVTGFDETENWLIGKVMNGCSVASDGVTYTCQLSGPGDYTGLIVWDTAGNEPYTPPSPTLYTQYRDLAGNVTSYSGGAVTVGIGPILFEN
jgi:hypothetical protein